MDDETKKNTVIPEQLNMASYFLDHNIAQGRGGRVAVYWCNQRFTYNDIFALANKVGNVLKELGVEIENRVYLVLQDSPELVASFYGTMKIGAAPNVAYTYLSPSDYEYEINLIRPKVIVADSTCIDRLREATKETKYSKTFLVLGQAPSELRKGEHDFYGMVKLADEHLETEATHKDDVASFLYTGGTTGHSKLVPIFHNTLVRSFDSCQQVLHYTEDDVILPIPKLFFGYARTGTIVHPFRVGAAAVLSPERTTPEKIFELIEQHRPTILINVPTMMRKMLQTPKEQRTDLSCIRLCTSGGEALSPQLYHEWRENFGCEVLDMLGSAEMGYAYILGRPGEVVPGSVGKLLPGYEAKIADDEGRELPDGEIGVLMVKGPTSGLYYWHEHEKSKQTFRGEWVYTTDLFKRDGKGNYWFCGREDDLLKVSGIFISPLEIEKCIQAHPDVTDCAVVGVKDVDGLDKTKSFVVLRKGVAPSESMADEIRKYTKEKLSPYKFPRFVEFIDELPKSASGKVDRLKLKQLP